MSLFYTPKSLQFQFIFMKDSWSCKKYRLRILTAEKYASNLAGRDAIEVAHEGLWRSLDH